MRPCVELDEFLERPVGRSFAGPCWLYFFPHEKLCGFSIWGRPDGDAIERLVRVLRVELAAAPHVSLVDARALDAVEPEAFDALGAYVVANTAALSRVVTRLALVLPTGGMMRAVTSGFFRVAEAPYPVSSFDELESALEWLGIDASVAEPELLESAREAAMDVTPLLRDLRAWLESNPGEATVERAARTLGVATRSLQRRLRDEGTSFQQESRSALVRVAQRMLREPAWPITRIALELGLTPAHFSAHFRKETGMSPTEWRRINVRGS